MPTTAILDGDIIAYRAAFWADAEGIEDLPGRINQDIKNWTPQGVDTIYVAMSCPRSKNFRRMFWPEYKKHREDFKSPDSMPIALETIYAVENISVRCVDHLEADDLIAGWVQAHPNDNHVIISTDGDFAQLIAPNCKQYNGIQDITITHEGYFDKKGDRVIDKKTKEVKPAPQPDFMLFEKCMRGDTSDNVFSAYPGVRKKGSKNKTGLLEAFADKDKGGFNWNNIMLQRWTDHNEVEHRVRDDYERNRTLIDLTAQPRLFRDNTDIVVKKGVSDKKEVTQVGVHFMRFCGKYELNRISDQADSYAKLNDT